MVKIVKEADSQGNTTSIAFVGGSWGDRPCSCSAFPCTHIRREVGLGIKTSEKWCKNNPEAAESSSVRVGGKQRAPEPGMEERRKVFKDIETLFRKIEPYVATGQHTCDDRRIRSWAGELDQLSANLSTVSDAKSDSPSRLFWKRGEKGDVPKDLSGPVTFLLHSLHREIAKRPPEELPEVIVCPETEQTTAELAGGPLSEIDGRSPVSELSGGTYTAELPAGDTAYELPMSQSDALARTYIPSNRAEVEGDSGT